MASRIAAPNCSRYRFVKSLSSGVCIETGGFGGGGAGLAGAAGLTAGDGAASALAGATGGVGVAPAASGFGLSGDWGALGSSAMDPGTIQLQSGSRAKLSQAPICSPENVRKLGR